MPKCRFPECETCLNREHDPDECEDCEDGSNYEPIDDDWEEDSIEELTLADFRGTFKVAA